MTYAVSDALDVPAVLASLVYRDRDLITSSYGLAAPIAMLLSHAFRQRVFTTGHPLVIPDARRDALLRLNRAVRDGSVRACVAMRFGTTDGEAVGTLCAMDPTPRRWTTAELTILDQLSGLLVSEIESAADVQMV